LIGLVASAFRRDSGERVGSAFRRNDWRRAALYCALWMPAAIAIGVLNAYWYGSPFLSGYGDPYLRYSKLNIWPNLIHYLAWLVQSQSAWIAVAALSLAVFARRPGMRAPLAL